MPAFGNTAAKSRVDIKNDASIIDDLYKDQLTPSHQLSRIYYCLEVVNTKGKTGSLLLFQGELNVATKNETTGVSSWGDNPLKLRIHGDAEQIGREKWCNEITIDAGDHITQFMVTYDPFIDPLNIIDIGFITNNSLWFRARDYLPSKSERKYEETGVWGPNITDGNKTTVLFSPENQLIGFKTAERNGYMKWVKAITKRWDCVPAYVEPEPEPTPDIPPGDDPKEDPVETPEKDPVETPEEEPVVTPPQKVEPPVIVVEVKRSTVQAEEEKWRSVIIQGIVLFASAIVLLVTCLGTRAVLNYRAPRLKIGEF